MAALKVKLKIYIGSIGVYKTRMEVNGIRNMMIINSLIKFKYLNIVWVS